MSVWDQLEQHGVKRKNFKIFVMSFDRDNFGRICALPPWGAPLEVLGIRPGLERVFSFFETFRGSFSPLKADVLDATQQVTRLIT